MIETIDDNYLKHEFLISSQKFSNNIRHFILK